MELKDTIMLMESPDYKDRFKAEYYQLKVREEKLTEMVKKWDNEELGFTPICPREMYDEQLAFMKAYREVLEKRAVLEKVAL